MRRALIFILCVRAVDIGAAVDKDACAAEDRESDNCALLQGSASLNLHSSDDGAKSMAGDAHATGSAQKSHMLATEKGPFDSLVKGFKKTVADFSSGIEDALKEIKDKVAELKSKAQKVSDDLLVIEGQKVPKISAKVQLSFGELEKAADALADAVAKALKEFAAKLGFLPKDLTAQVQSGIGEVEKEARGLAKTYDKCATRLASTKVTDVCPVLKSGLEKLRKQADTLAEKASLLTWDKLKSDVEGKLDELPVAADKVKDLIEKVSAAATEIKSELPSSLGKVEAAIAKVFEAKCPALTAQSRAFRLQFATLTTLACVAASVLSLF